MDTCRFGTGRRALVTLSPSWKLSGPSGQNCPGTRHTAQRRKPPSPLRRLRHPRSDGTPPGRSLHPAPTILDVLEGELGTERRDPDSLGKQATDGPVPADLTLALREPWWLYSGAMVGSSPQKDHLLGDLGLASPAWPTSPAPTAATILTPVGAVPDPDPAPQVQRASSMFSLPFIASWPPSVCSWGT